MFQPQTSSFSLGFQRCCLFWIEERVIKVWQQTFISFLGKNLILMWVLFITVIYIVTVSWVFLLGFHSGLRATQISASPSNSWPFVWPASSSGNGGQLLGFPGSKKQRVLSVSFVNALMGLTFLTFCVRVLTSQHVQTLASRRLS